MLEKVFSYHKSEQKLIEKLINDEHLLINHVVLAEGDRIPEHYSNSNVYLLIIKGTMTLILSDEEEKTYSDSNILQIPYNTKMNIKNINNGKLEFFIVKAPSPDYYNKKYTGGNTNE